MGVSSFHIRKATLKDSQAVALVVAAVYNTCSTYPPRADVPTEKDIYGWFTNVPYVAQYVACEQSGKIVGHIGVVKPGITDIQLTGILKAARINPGSVLEICRLVVHPQNRGQRLGKELLKTAHQRIYESNTRPVLDVLASQQKALGLYRNAGYTQIGRWLNIFEQPVLTMLGPSAATIY